MSSKRNIAAIPLTDFAPAPMAKPAIISSTTNEATKIIVHHAKSDRECAGSDFGEAGHGTS